MGSTAATDLKSQLVQDILKNRAELTANLTEIESRLSPDRVKEQLVTQLSYQLEELKVRFKAAITQSFGSASARRIEPMFNSAEHKMKQAALTTIDTVKRHPIPIALAGIGIAWFLLGRRASQQRKSRHAIQRAMTHIQEGTAHSAGLLMQGVQNIERYIDQGTRENPVAFGAVAWAIGSAIGAALPRTQFEDQYFGATREKVAHKAEAAAHQVIAHLQSDPFPSSHN